MAAAQPSAEESAKQAQQAAKDAAAAQGAAEKAQKGAEAEAQSAKEAATLALCAAMLAADPDNEDLRKAQCAKETLALPAKESPRQEPDSGFDNVTFFGSANVIAGSLSSDDGAFATGGVGVVASSGGLAFSAAVAFGSTAVSTENVTRDQYAQFLLAPSAAIGVQAQLKKLWRVSKRELWAGFGFGARLNGHQFTFADDETQTIGMLSLDPTASASLTLSKKRKIDFFLDLGLALRFWRQPKAAFEDALDLDEDASAFWGIRALTAFQIGNIYFGVEATKLTAFGDASFSQFTDFAVLPYIGFRTGFGLEPVKEEETVADCAKNITSEKAASAKRSPPATPVF